MTDVLIQLPRASWREIEFPISSREYGFQQSQAPHRFIFKDDQLIESIGRDNPTYRYTIPFREDVTGGAWSHLFIGVYPDFLNACQDRTRGVLTDPVHSSIPAKCVSLRETMDMNRRDGLDVEAEFIFAPTENDFSSARGISGLVRTLQCAKDFALRLDTEVAAINWQQQLPPDPTINPLDLVSTFSDQVDVAGNQVTAAFGDAALRAERTSDAITKLKNPSLEPQRQQARRLREALLSIEDKTDPTGTKPLRRITNTTDRTVSAVAKLLGMTVQELLRLNPALRRTPLVKAGAELRVTSAFLAANARR
jgi:DNA circularisation protein N-terminus